MNIAERFEPNDRADWRRWLRANHKTSKGIWLVYLKGAARQISYDAAVEEALCYGWIDTTLRPIDERCYMQLFTPRKPRSTWSALNKRRVEALIERKLMTRAGLAAIEIAQQNGSWSSIDSVESLTPPPELAKGFARNRKAKAFYDSLAPSKRKTILYWINGVKSPALRAERIAHVIAQAANGLRPAPHEAVIAKMKRRSVPKARKRT